MFIVLLDGPELLVFQSPADAVREVEPIDAESEIRAAFDDFAVPYRVECVRPDFHRRLFRLIPVVEPGEYRLVPSGPPQPEALIELLEEHPTTDPLLRVPPVCRGRLPSATGWV